MTVIFLIVSVLWKYYDIHFFHVNNSRSVRIVSISRDFLQQFLHTFTLTCNKTSHLLSGVFEGDVAASFRMMMPRFCDNETDV